MATARVNLDYVWRTALFGIVFAGWGLWCVYDGVVAYPAFNKEHEYEVYAELREKAEAEAAVDVQPDSTAYERRTAVNKVWEEKYSRQFLNHLEGTSWWAEYKSNAQTKEGAPKSEREALHDLAKDYHSPSDIGAQYFMAAVCCPLGLGALAFVGINARRKFRADDEGLHGFANKPIPYDAIESIDWSLWDRKGIARMTVAVDGSQRTLKLDAWKFKGMGDILEAVEQKRPDLARPEPAEPAEEPSEDRDESEAGNEEKAAT